MKQLVINVEESRYALLLQFLRTLGYVKIVPASQPTKALPKDTQPDTSFPPSNQLALLRHTLQQQSTPLFQKIEDAADWQKQKRDEWS